MNINTDLERDVTILADKASEANKIHDLIRSVGYEANKIYHLIRGVGYGDMTADNALHRLIETHQALTKISDGLTDVLDSLNRQDREREQAAKKRGAK